MKPRSVRDGGDLQSDQEIRSVADIVTARHRARALAIGMGFDAADVTEIATSVAEIAREILDRAERGRIIVRAVSGHGERGLLVLANDGLHPATVALTKWLKRPAAA